MALMNPYRDTNPVTKARFQPLQNPGNRRFHDSWNINPTIIASGTGDYGTAARIGGSAGYITDVPDLPGVGHMDLDEYKRWILSLGPVGQETHMTNLATADANRRNEEFRRLGIGTLEDAHRTGSEAYQRYLNDPNRQNIFDELTRRTTDPLFSQAQRSAATNQLGQLYSQNLARMRQRAASAGVIDSGGQSGFEAGLGTATESANLQLQATMDAADRQAQDNALQLLGQYQAADVGLTQGFVSDLAKISGGIAALQAGMEVQPTDFMAFRAVQFAQQQWEDFSRLHWAEVERLEQAGKWGWQDTLNLFMSFIGTGAYRPLLNAFGGA